MKRKTAENLLYLTHLHRRLIFFFLQMNALIAFLKEAGEDEFTISVVTEL